MTAAYATRDGFTHRVDGDQGPFGLPLKATGDAGLWIELIDGVPYDLINGPHCPWPLTINQTARMLSRINRFHGATIAPYSVAQHSVHVAEIVANVPGVVVMPLDAAYALLHDVHEVVVGDIPSPIKQLLTYQNPTGMIGFEALCDAIDRSVFRAFGLPKTPSLPTHGAVKKADLIALATERRDLMPKSHHSWGPLPAPWERTIKPWNATEAAAAWSAAAYVITGGSDIA
ncbi:MAG: hypothetical protein AAGF32_03430 [Pseudomonadota bacterium]